MKSLLMAIFFLFPLAAEAGDWTVGDSLAQGGVVSLQIADWAQTRWFVKNQGYAETNPILGKHPSVGKVDTLNAMAIVAHGAISFALPHGPLRDGWQYIWIGIEADAVHSNKSMGVKFSF